MCVCVCVCGGGGGGGRKEGGVQNWTEINNRNRKHDIDTFEKCLNKNCRKQLLLFRKKKKKKKKRTIIGIYITINLSLTII